MFVYAVHNLPVGNSLAYIFGTDYIIFWSGLFQEKIPGRVGTPLILFYLGGGRKTYFFSGGCCQISI